MNGAPTSVDLADYRAGRLSPSRFAAVDGWLAAQDAETQVRLLDGPDAPADGLVGGLGTLAGELARPREAFLPDAGVERYRILGTIGSGGMGVVELAHDRALGREVALKRCRARQPDESLESHALRLRAFRREAAITAQLEHPAIVPVHEVGHAANGEPAFVMKRLEGTPLAVLVARRRAGGALDPGEVVGVILRVAEALAHAHARGIVHRDLKPENVVVGAQGAVSVIDWGLAATGVPTTAAGGTASPAPAPGDALGAGTLAWMAPEQASGAAADPRMDVFALGGLLMALLTGHGPRDAGPDGRIDLAPLAARGLPRALVAVARRCLAEDALLRYGDGAAVAADLRRWLSVGLTQAERPGPLKRVAAYLRTSPRLAAMLAAALLLAVVLAGQWAVDRERAQAQARDRLRVIMDGASLEDPASLRAARQQVRELPGGMPDSREGRSAADRLDIAIATHERRAALERQREALAGLARRYRQHGPWPAEVNELGAALRAAGVGLDHPAGDADTVRGHALRDELLAALVQLQRALLLDGRHPDRQRAIPALIVSATSEPAWHALADLLARAEVAAHDLVFCDCAASEQALADPRTADLLLATYGPEERLVRYASERIAADPGAFWPRVVSARAAYQGRRFEEARRHALVALGQEPRGLWPHLVLAYVALAESDQATLLAESRAALAANPEHLEAVVLEAVALARSGQREQAQARIALPGLPGHLRYHLAKPLGHPMEDAAHALVAAGIVIPAAAPDLGPVVPHGHEHAD